jgi:hypothetical protein
LEAELSPTPAATVVPSPAVASKPQTPVATNTAAIMASVTPVKPETNVAAPTTKPAPAISAPKVEPLPKKESPIEVAKLPDETPIKSAQDISPPKVSKPIATTSNVSVAPVNPVRTTSTPEKGASALTKLNPANWFKRKPKAVTPMTELPTTKTAIETSAVSLVVEPKPTPKIATKATEARTAPVIPRYKYRSPEKPPEGKRAEAEPFFARGVQAQKDRRLADAIGAYRQALKSDPSYFEANYNLALVAREAGDLSAALDAYEQALAIMPESVNARYNFAFTLQETGYFVDAANELRKLLAQNPNETRAHLLLGNLCAQRLNQISAARESYTKVLEAEPNHPQATQIRYWLVAHP